MVGDEIFPAKCFMRLDGKLMNDDGLYFLKEQQENNEKGLGVQHPCYLCDFNAVPGICNAATINYYDKEKRWLMPPKVENTVLA
ncbi:MAG: hypothetical protein KKB25_02925 [Nanoarchaeota archaeon]|nr:hypothetical protein [Nanoarchaeota archaeon]